MPKKYTKAEAMEQALKSVTAYYGYTGEPVGFSGFNPSGEFFEVFESENEGAGFAVNRYAGYDEDDEEGVDEIDGGQVVDLRFDRKRREVDESRPKPSEKDIRGQVEYLVETAGF